jgi:hypothetical protein
MNHRRARTAAITLCGTSVAIAATSVALAASGTNVPTKDSFHGRVTGATGAFKGDRGEVAIDLAIRTSNTATRQLTITVRGGRCGSAPRCVQLTGKVTGTITQVPTNPDVGRSFKIDASGTVRPLGLVASSGSAHGTGFIVRAHETLHLTLTTPRGQIVIDARSATVPGFTSP